MAFRIQDNTPFALHNLRPSGKLAIYNQLATKNRLDLTTRLGGYIMFLLRGEFNRAGRKTLAVFTGPRL